ncbi:MAG: family 2 glycosyl transferase [Leptolyngbyaceae cyanobacterium bins.349]|nr:family 2 glycosyl transferase [Leptolyngbyaceae cyanobacterium bins.349]
MGWQICIRYPNGQERAICAYRNREVALRRVDAIYSQGYPMHVAYIVRPIEDTDAVSNDASLGCFQFV